MRSENITATRSVQQAPPSVAQQRALAATTDGELLGSITLSAREVASFNRARERLDCLVDLLNRAVIPALGGSNHPVAHEILGLAEQVRVHSGNLLWSYSPNNSAAYRARMRESDV